MTRQEGGLEDCIAYKSEMMMVIVACEVTQNVDPQAMQDGRVAKSANHAEQGKLAEVEDSSGRERPC